MIIAVTKRAVAQILACLSPGMSGEVGGDMETWKASAAASVSGTRMSGVLMVVLDSVAHEVPDHCFMYDRGSPVRYIYV